MRIIRILVLCSVALLGTTGAWGFSGETKEQEVGSRDARLAGYAPLQFGMSFDEAKRALGEDGIATECQLRDEEGVDQPPIACIKFIQFTQRFQTTVTQFFPDNRAGLALAMFEPIGNQDQHNMMPADVCPSVATLALSGLTAQMGKPDGAPAERTESNTPGGPVAWFVRQWQFTFERGGLVTLEQRYAPAIEKCSVRIFYRPAA